MQNAPLTLLLSKFLSVEPTAEPVFVKVKEAQESIPVAYVAWQAGGSNRVVVPARQAGYRFLAPKKAYKFGLWLHL
jgi:hypothetical protein